MAKRPVNFRLDEDLIEKIRAAAKGRGWTTTEFVTRALERVVEGEQARKRPEASR